MNRYVERNSTETVTANTNPQPKFTVERKRNFEYQLDGKGEWHPDSEVDSVSVLIMGDEDYTFGRFMDKEIYIEKDNIDMLIQVLQDVKASGVLGPKTSN